MTDTPNDFEFPEEDMDLREALKQLYRISLNKWYYTVDLFDVNILNQWGLLEDLEIEFDQWIRNCHCSTLGVKLIDQYIASWEPNYVDPTFKQPPSGTLRDLFERDTNLRKRLIAIMERRKPKKCSDFDAYFCALSDSKSDEDSTQHNESNIPNNGDSQVVPTLNQSDANLQNTTNNFKSKEEFYLSIKDHYSRSQTMHKDGYSWSEIGRWEKEHCDKLDNDPLNPLPSTSGNAISKRKPKKQN